MFLNGGKLGNTRLLAPSTVGVDDVQRTEAGDWLRGGGLDTGVGDIGPTPAMGQGFGLGFAVRTEAGENPLPGSVGSFYWTGAYGTTFYGRSETETDRHHDDPGAFGGLLARAVSAHGAGTLAYQALTAPELRRDQRGLCGGAASFRRGGATRMRSVPARSPPRPAGHRADPSALPAPPASRRRNPGQSGARGGTGAVVIAGAVAQPAAVAVERQQGDQQESRRPFSPVGRIVPKRSATMGSPGRQTRNLSGRPRFGVAGRTTEWPRSCRAVSSGRTSISSPMGQKPDTTAAGGGGQSRSTSAVNALPAATGSAPFRAARQATRMACFDPWRSAETCGAAMAVRVSSSQSLRVQVAPDTETKIPAEPVPWGDAHWPWGCIT